jgi:hypothetical protein
MWYGILADVSALLHGLVVLYIAGGFLTILAGLWRRWALVRSFWFRFSHLLLCGIVLVLELANQPCPLTTLEQWLREQATAGSAYQGAFIAHYVHQAIHVPAQPQSLAWPMCAFAAVVAWLYIRHGPLPEEVEPAS